MSSENVMNDQTTLKKVADLARIADSYVSAWGTEAKVEDDTIRQLLAAIGYDVSSDKALLDSATKLNKKRYSRTCDCCPSKSKH